MLSFYRQWLRSRWAWEAAVLGRARGRPPRRSLGVEPLEDRTAPAILTVNSIVDNNVRDANLTLREAIKLVNGTLAYNDLNAAEKAQVDDSVFPLGVDDVIRFNIGDGVQKIAVTGSALDAVMFPVTIDGTAPAAHPDQVIQIDGGGLAALNSNGLTISGGDSIVQSLTVTGFTGYGIALNGNGNDEVINNSVGIDPTGANAGNGNYGIAVLNVPNNTIGGDPTKEATNLISFNKGGGVYIQGVNATSNQVMGNTIDSNLLSGVSIQAGASNNAIGKDLNGNGFANTITANTGNGVYIFSADNNVVLGNFIGMQEDVPGRAGEGTARGNGGNGVNVVAGKSNTIGGAGALRNVISANRLNGVSISDVDASGNQVLGNWIGLNLLGSANFDGRGAYTGNGRAGVLVDGAVNTSVGTTDAGNGNVISGNNGNGVYVKDGRGNSVVNNRLGTDNTGAEAVVNGDVVILAESAPAVIITRNTGFRAAGKAAVSVIASPGAKANGNDIEVEPEPPAPAIGVNTVVVNSSDVTIGGTLAGDGNVLDGGLSIQGSSNVTVQGNFIGVNANDTSFGNTGDDIFIDSASTAVTVGGSAAGAGNRIGGSAGAGARIDGAATVQGNTFDATNSVGVVVEGSSSVHLAQNALPSLVVTGGAVWLDGANTVGTITLNGGALTVANPGDALTVTGAYTQTNGGTSLLSGTSLAVQGALLEQAGMISLAGASLQAAGGLSVQSGAFLLGSGTITAAVTNSGMVVVGGMSAVGTLHVAGNYTQTASGGLMMEAAGTSALDQLLIDGVASLGGSLNVSLLGGYSPSPGDVLDLITYGSRSGTFGSLNLPWFSGGHFVPRYDTPANTFSLLASS